jgi:hypothetical protein
MAERNKTKRNLAEKIALPVILVISLLAARFVVGLRAVIRMTSPIELSRSGLSISMPQGNGWRCGGKWVYVDDGYVVSSTFAVRAGAFRSHARCHYILASQQQTAQDRFSEEAAALGGEVVETGRMEADRSGQGKSASAGGLVVDWARLVSKGEGLEVILSVCDLAGGRQLEIEVFQAENEQGLAQNIFERIVKGIQFRDNGFLQAGEKVISEAKQAGAKDFVDGNQPVFFVLSDSKKRPIGFTMDSIELQAGEESALRAASYFYRRRLPAFERVSYYYGDTSFDKFEWMFRESRPRTGRIGIEMSAESGVLTVRKSGLAGKEKEYTLGEAVVPDIVLEPILKSVLESSPREIVIDVIRPEGNIVPVYVEKASEPDSNSLKLEVLDGSGYQQHVYYDDVGQPVKIVIKQDGTYTLNRATAEQIAKTFPERAALVLQQDRQLERKGI